MTRCRQSENLEVIPHPINASDSLSEGAQSSGGPAHHPATVAAFFDRSGLVGAFFRCSPDRPWMAVSADDGHGNECGGASVRDAVCCRLGGFLASIFGGLALRRLQGPDPERRGRGWAVFATAGIRGLLMVVSGTLGSVVLGRGGVEEVIPSFCCRGGSRG